jgi:type VI secretion system secreted protein VgrG
MASANKLDVNAAVKYLDDHTLLGSVGLCAHYVRMAIAAGGISINPYPALAKLYGPYLGANGFAALSQDNYAPAKGDVIVLQNYPGGDTAGHIAMYDGSQWVSDFKQRDMWAGPGFRKYRPAHAFYRP